MKGFLIAADKSGAGKTTITTGIIAALTKQGLNIAPFKCGPDYIDTMHLSKASGNMANNLDTVLLNKNKLQEIFIKASLNKDISIVEGVMGLFDGIGYKDFHGSSYEIASILGLPVILSLNTASTSFSIAATIKGFEELCKNTSIVGVILNNVASYNHEKLLINSINYHTNIKVIGAIERQDKNMLSSRHLGIKTAIEINNNYFEKCAELAEKYLDLEFLKNLRISKSLSNVVKNENSVKADKKCYLAYDKAFNFYYDANLEFLKNIGYEIVKFSPLNNETVENADFVYLGGGYPEIYAEKLTNNIEFLNSIKNHFKNNKPMLAECGGMMILTNGINTNKRFYKMAEIFDAKTIMTEKRQALGYVKAKYENKEFVGHEFHYSNLENVNEKFVFELEKITTKKKTFDGFFKKKTLASYTHFHFLSNPNILELIL